MKERREGEKREDSAKEGGREGERARAPEAERLREAETEKRESWGD